MTLYVTAKEIPYTDYLTPGKLYEVVKAGEFGFSIVDDTGDTIACIWKNCAHLDGGDWERVEGMKYDVTGVDIHLLNEVISGDADQLSGAFVWGSTPQGHDYWSKQRIGELPLDIPALKEIRRQYLADEEETPTLWRDMTPEQKGALLVAAYEGKVIEVWSGVWKELIKPSWYHDAAYRIKPAPKVEVVKVYYPDFPYSFTCSGDIKGPTHRITFNTVDGIPDCDSVKMERI